MREMVFGIHNLLMQRHKFPEYRYCRKYLDCFVCIRRLSLPCPTDEEVH